MSAPNAEISSELPCHRCGYDLRAHPPDGHCPECGALVAEARAQAAIPSRPKWRDSDPRWRRRVLAGVWILVLLPLIDVLKASDRILSLSVPSVFDWKGPLPLGDTFIFGWGWGLGVYQPLIFCMGIVLLFSKERSRRRNRLDWTRRWGVLCSYVVFLLSAAQILFISALVLLGIAALFNSIPLKYQPGSTSLFARLGYGLMRYGPHPQQTAFLVLVAFSCVTVLLACIPLFDALRSSGPKRLAILILAPLPLFALIHLDQAAIYAFSTFRFFFRPSELVGYYAVYFYPSLLFARFIAFRWGISPSGSFIECLMEATKWLVICTIAIWLSIAQLAAWRQRKNSGAE